MSLTEGTGGRFFSSLESFAPLMSASLARADCSMKRGSSSCLRAVFSSSEISAGRRSEEILLELEQQRIELL